jgi:flagellar basal body-associated protein FliL
MKKWQMWTIVVIGGVLVAAASGALYWWLTMDAVAPATEPVVKEQTVEQMELDSVKKELDSTEELDTAEIDDAVKEIEAVDLSGV